MKTEQKEMEREEEKVDLIDFMKLSRFNTIRNKLNAIDPKAEAIISKAHDDDVLMLSFKFNTPFLSVVAAEVFTKEKFVEFVF